MNWDLAAFPERQVERHFCQKPTFDARPAGIAGRQKLAVYRLTGFGRLSHQSCHSFRKRGVGRDPIVDIPIVPPLSKTGHLFITDRTAAVRPIGNSTVGESHDKVLTRHTHGTAGINITVSGLYNLASY